jgi:carboxyl-terminal processing protease
MKLKAYAYIVTALLILAAVSLACTLTLGRGPESQATPTAAEVLTAEPAPPTQEQEAATPTESGPAEATETQTGDDLSQTEVEPTTIAPPTRQAPSEPIDRDELFEPFWEAWQLVNEQYVDQPVDQELLMRGAIQGMLEALGDQHTTYMDPDQFRQANIPLEQEYEGIGAWVDTTLEFLTIVTPMPDSPAEKAGLRPGDKVIAIDGEDMTGIDGNLVIRRVIGPAGTTVRLTIQRDGPEGTEPEIFDVEITRARITVPSVDTDMLEGGLAYVQLLTFADNTRDELRAALRDLLAQNPSGLILDLRNNGGGYLSTSVEVASEFISDGVVLIEEYGDGQRDVFNALPGGLATDIPMVVLINEGTASASEIVAGALQDYGRAVIVGTTSFGKGSVQSWVPLRNDEGAVRVTIARWLTPNERQIHEVGLTPDIVVEMTEEDRLAELDPQLDRAIEILLNP